MKKSIRPLLFLLVTFCISCGSNQSKEKPASKAETPSQPSLKLVWESDTTLSTCESVYYDSKTGTIYVANINEGPWEDDGNGFISTIDNNGKVLIHKWVEGLSAPKGMGISNGKLYVNDISNLVEIDIATRKITKRYKVEGDPKLNDITVSPDGTVYASGSNSNTIYVLKNGKLEIMLNHEFGRLNGLLYQPEGMYYASSNSSEFGLVDMKTNTAKVLADGIGHGDGIIVLKNGDFIVSSWKGQVFYIKKSDWSAHKMLDTESMGLNAADIEYIPEQNLLMVPTFFGNKIMSYNVITP